MSFVSYGKKRFLIVDNIKPSRDALKQLAISLNAARIDSTLYPNDVISMCQNIDYDIIFLGYDLGENQKNGQQILEELRTNGNITRQCIVIIITAENSQEMVLAALEHKPDEYLTKPYTLNQISSRLDRCFNKKNEMSEIYQALDANNAEKVIKLCEYKLRNGTDHKLECLGIKSRQHFEAKQYKQAKRIYLTYQDTPHCQWAIIGLGKIALLEKEASYAIGLFNQMIKEHPCYLSTYDWLSQAYLTLDQFKNAEEILATALQISPRSVFRLKVYADLCFINENYEKSAQAYLSATELAYNSIHHHPDNALNFAKSLVEYSSDLSLHIAKKLNNKAFKSLSIMTKEFKKAELRVQAHLLSACLYRNTKEFRQATDLLNQAKKVLDKTQENLSPKSLIEMSKSFIRLDEKKAANQLVTTLIDRCHEDLVLMTEIDKLTDESQSKFEQTKTQQTLNIAASLYRNRDYQSAIIKLKRALRLYPEHLSIRLNLLQVLLVAYETKPNDKMPLHQATELIKSFAKISHNSRSYLRFEKLNEKFKSLQHIEIENNTGQ